MKQTSFRQNLTWLRICIALFMLAIVSLFLFSFTVSRRLPGDIWKQLGLSELQGAEKVKNSFLNNYLDYYGVRNAKNIAMGDRAAVATDLLNYSRQYLGSNTFRQEYDRMRAQAKPVEPAGKIRTKEDVRKEKIEETKKSIKETEELIRTGNADMKKILQSVLEMHQNNLKEYQDPNSAMIELFFQGEEYSRNNDITHYQENLANWNTTYPADYKQMIRLRLERYLSLASTVDFNAELVDRNGKKKFVNPEYEAKNYEWKMIFRAGKPVYDVTSAFAKQWLKEL